LGWRFFHFWKDNTWWSGYIFVARVIHWYLWIFYIDTRLSTLLGVSASILCSHLGSSAVFMVWPILPFHCAWDESLVRVCMWVAVFMVGLLGWDCLLYYLSIGEFVLLVVVRIFPFEFFMFKSCHLFHYCSCFDFLDLFNILYFI